MLKNIESITRIIAHLAFTALMGYLFFAAKDMRDEWKQLSEKIGGAFGENRVTIAFEMKMPEGSNSPAVDLTSTFMKLILPSKTDLNKPKPVSP